MTEPDLILTGKRAALGPLSREHLPAIARWFNDPETRRGHGAADGELVGVCSLERIDHNFSRAELGMFVGERRGTGIGTDAVRLTLDWAFNMLGLHNVMLETFAFNQQATRAYLRAGFREIGRRRNAVRTLGRRWDSILMDATAADFDSPVLAGLRPRE